MSSLFLEFSLVFGLSVIVGIVMRFLRQPAFLGYVLVGLVFSVFSFGLDRNLFLLMSSAGITLLLFLVGMEINVKVFKELSSKVLFIGFGQVILTSLLFWAIFLGFSVALPVAIILGIAFSFSSTIIVVKLLSEKHELESLHGRIGVAILLIQDMTAISLLIVFNEKPGSDFLIYVLKAAFLILATILIAQRIMPRLLHRLAKSTDELILFSLAWCFGVASLVASPILGMSIEVGGLMAGLALSGSFEHSHIVNKIRPIRDFFLTIFFVGLGLTIKLDKTVVFSVILLSAAILIFKPTVVWILARLYGYRQKVSFHTGILMGQTSEFSLVLINILFARGLISGQQMALVSMSSILTMVISAYLISDGRKVYELVKPALNFLFKDSGAGETIEEKYSQHIILFGCHRTGMSILHHLEKLKEDVLIVDYDPEVIEKLGLRGKMVAYGDVTDVESYAGWGVTRAKLIISTVKDVNDSLLLLSEINKKKLKVPVIVNADSHKEALDLYEAGAAYAVFPHFVSGLHLGELIKKGLLTKEDFVDYKNMQKESMTDIYE